MDRRTWGFLGAGLVVALVFGVVLSQFASSSPDGLEYVAEREGFADAELDHTFADAPLADYGGNLTDNSTINTAVAGALGVAVTLIIGYGIFWVTRRIGGNGRSAMGNR